MEHIPTVKECPPDIAENIDSEIITNISQLPKDFYPEWRHGDILNTSNFRESGYFFINKNGDLHRNPDYSKAGYLTVPWVISNEFKNAMTAYQNICPMDIELSVNDEFIKDFIGDFPSSFRFRLNDLDTLYVTYPDFKKKFFILDDYFGKEYNKEKIQKQILDWWELAKNDKRVVFELIVFQEVSKKKHVKVPFTWDYTGKVHGTDKFHFCIFTFNGYLSKMNLVIDYIKTKYEKDLFIIEGKDFSLKSYYGPYQRNELDPYGRNPENGLNCNFNYYIKNGRSLKYLHEKWESIKLYEYYSQEKVKAVLLIQKLIRGFIERKKVLKLVIEQIIKNPDKLGTYGEFIDKLFPY